MASTAPEVHADALTAPLEGTDAGPYPQALANADAGGKKRKGQKRNAAKDVPLAKEESQEGLKPLPEDASGTWGDSPESILGPAATAHRLSGTGFRKRQKKDGYVPVRSSSIPGMTVGDVRKSLNQIRKAGESIQSNHLLWNG